MLAEVAPVEPNGGKAVEIITPLWEAVKVLEADFEPQGFTVSVSEEADMRASLRGFEVAWDEMKVSIYDMLDRGIDFME